MRRVLCRVAVTIVLLTLAMASSAEAAVVLNDHGAGSGSVAYEGLAHFVNPSVFSANLEDTIIEKEFVSFGPILFDDVEFDAADLDWPAGFRWTERIHNKTNVDWLDYHLQLDDTPGVFFTDLPTFSPSFTVINGGGPIVPPSGIPQIVKTDSLGTVVLSTDRKSLSFYFATPLAPGSFFDIHTPIERLSGVNSFQLAQYPTVPEPCTLLIWSLLGACCGAAAWYRRRRSS